MSHIQSIVHYAEINGTEMGILADGTPFLSGRSLARLCGVDPRAIIFQAQQWGQNKRSNDLASLLVAAGFQRPSLYEVVQAPNRAVVHADLEDVVMLILNYYAYARPLKDAGGRVNQAWVNYNKLARAKFRELVYQSLGVTSPALVAPTKAPNDREIMRRMIDSLIEDQQRIEGLEVGQRALQER